MEQSEDDLVGEPIDEVPQREPGEECNARRNDRGRFVGYCNRTSGWGTDQDYGRCRTHGQNGGAPEDNDNATGNDGGAAPEGNANAASHELYSQSNTYYQRRDAAAQALIDAIYEDYQERFVSRHGEPTTGDDAMLFKVAISIHKLLKADEWETTRPDTLDSGHPLVDRSEKRTAQGDSYYEYKRTAVLQAEKQLEGFIRRWLKDNDLLAPEDDGADIEVELTGAMWEDLTGYYDEQE